MKDYIKSLINNNQIVHNLKRGLLLDVDYDGGQNKIYCKFYDLDDDKIRIWLDTTKFKPYCLARNIDEEEFENLDRFDGLSYIDSVNKFDLLEDKSKKFAKVFGKTPYDIGGRDGIRNIIRDTWESNIRYHHTYIYDKQLKVGLVYEIKNGKIIHPNRYRTYNGDSPEISEFGFESIELFFEKVPNITRMAMDIEIEMDEGRMPNPEEVNKKIISCSFKSNDGLSLVYLLIRDASRGINSDFVKVFATEKSMIEHIFKLMWKFPIIITFNGDNFDFPYLYNRAKKLGISENRVPIRKPKKGYGIFARTECFLKYGIHIDLYPFFSNKSISTYAFQSKYKRNSLDVISKALLGEGKIEHEKSIDEMNYDKLIKYNLKDSELTLKLTTYNDNSVWKIMILICRLSCLPIHDMLRHQISAWIRSLLHNEHRRKNYLIPNQKDIRNKKKGGFSKAIIEGKAYEGAYVIEPIPGRHYDTVVMDFASLYTSIMKEHNLSYETINCGHPECQIPIKGIPYHTCKRKMGIFAYVMGFLRDIRVNYFKPKGKTDPYYKIVEQTLKVFINGSYGVLGSKNFPYFCLPVAESITGIGRSSIKRIVKKSEGMGIEVLYGDTDSVFLDDPSNKQTDALIKFSKNILGLDLEKEKTFQFLALSHRKKNYVGILKDSHDIEMKGIMGKKKNTPEFIKYAIANLNFILTRIKDEKTFMEQRKLIIKDVRLGDKGIGDPDEELEDYIINTIMNKNPEDYIKTTPQHVKAVRTSGLPFQKGDVISYIKTNDKIGAKIASLAKLSDINVKKYKQLYQSSLEQILDALDIDWDEIKGQTKLGDY